MIKYLLISLLLILAPFRAIIAQELYVVSSPAFNTREYDEFAAVPYKDGVVFCTNRPQSAFAIRTDSSGKPLNDLYFAKKTGDKWERNPRVFSKELNSKYHEGPMTFNKEGTAIYFTLGETVTEGIYTANYTGNKWSEIMPFPFNETVSKCAQPCLSADGTKLFFASNRRGGSGKFDLYVCLWNRNQWGRPKNLGSEINSTADDKYPFYHKNGKLYFASNRTGGVGGFDIYFSREIEGKWTIPQLVAEPINSSKDDFAFYSDSIDRHGYFSSDRANRYRVADILEFTFNFPVIDSAQIQETNSYTFLLSEPSSMNIDTTSFKYEWEFGDGTKHLGKELEIEHTYAATGDYNIKLNIIDTITNTVQENKLSTLLEVRDIEQPYITCPDTSLVGVEILFDASKTNLPNFTIANYYWDFGDDHIALGKEVKHIYTEAGVYKVTLTITSVPDSNNKINTETRFRQLVVKKATSN